MSYSCLLHVWTMIFLNSFSPSAFDCSSLLLKKKQPLFTGSITSCKSLVIGYFLESGIFSSIFSLELPRNDRSFFLSHPGLPLRYLHLPLTQQFLTSPAITEVALVVFLSWPFLFRLPTTRSWVSYKPEFRRHSSFLWLPKDSCLYFLALITSPFWASSLPGALSSLGDGVVSSPGSVRKGTLYEASLCPLVPGGVQ